MVRWSLKDAGSRGFPWRSRYRTDVEWFEIVEGGLHGRIGEAEGLEARWSGDWLGLPTGVEFEIANGSRYRRPLTVVEDDQAAGTD